MPEIKPQKVSNNFPILFTLIFIPILFIFGTLFIFIIVNTNNRPDITLTLLEPKSLSKETASFSVTITGDQNRIVEKGFVYDTNPEPSLSSRDTNVSPITGLFWGGSYTGSDSTVLLTGNETTATVNNLYTTSAYYVRAYVKTSSGIIYSNELSFLPGKDKPTSFIYSNSYPVNTPQDRDSKRIVDVNYLLDSLIKLNQENPQLLNTARLRQSIRQNLTLSDKASCTFSLAKQPLYITLPNNGMTIPVDPQTKSTDCSDYTITIERDNSITVEAPNAETTAISVRSDRL